MFQQISRTGPLAGAVAGMFLSVGCAACAASPDRPHRDAQADRGYPRSLVGQRLNVGQGVYIVPAQVPVAGEGPYALTGDDSDAASDRAHRAFTGPTGRWLDVGQGRVWVPPAP